MTLTGKQVRNLAEFVGFDINDQHEHDESITECEVQIFKDDTGKLLVVYSEYPEEGSMEL